MRLLEPIILGTRTAPNRVVFGPHETNLARGRAISDRHVAYYRRRAEGGAGVIVTEEASVHPSDWPYERAPLAELCGPGWAAVKSACAGSLVLAAIGHAGGQGSSAYSQAPLWAPSRVPEVNTREVPKWMEDADITAVVAGFGDATRLAVGSGLDGVEVNAGQFSLIRQFLSGLTNHREDAWGTDRLAFARAVLEAVRDAAGDAVVGLRLSCDELAPWAGIVPAAAVEIAAALAPLVDYITVVRGSIFTASATRPDTHVPPGFNRDLTAAVRAGVPLRTRVVAQGSIVAPEMAEAFLDEGVCDLVEMTRAQIADANLVALAATPERVRPCILCNQACQVRDARNPIVSCVADPHTGHEWEESDVWPLLGPAAHVLVVGAGPAGLECARVARSRGHEVTVACAEDEPGGMVRVAARGAGRASLAWLVDWLVRECERLGVTIRTGWTVTDLSAWDGPVVVCTGSVPGVRSYAVEDGAVVVDAAVALAEGVPGTGRVAVWDPIGGPIGISVASLLVAERPVALITPDLIAGNELSRSGDLAPANVRLQAAGVVIERRSLLRAVRHGSLVVEDRFTEVTRTIEADAVVDAGYRLPGSAGSLGAVGRAGDAVAPRTIYEAVLEGRRQGAAVSARAVRV